MYRHQYHEEIESGHGRVESRKYWISDNNQHTRLNVKVAWLNERGYGGV